MNFTSLSTQTMLAHSQRLTTQPEPRAILAAHPMGPPTLDELGVAHQDLAEVVGARKYTLAEIGRLRDLIETLDFTHDECARALYYALEALGHDTSDPQKAARYRQAKQRLFPDGLEIVRRSYSDESGAVIERRAQMTSNLRQLLDNTAFGSSTLGALLDNWNQAGQELGDAFLQRAQLQVGLKGGGTLQIATDHRAKRHRWARVMRALLMVIEVIEPSPEEREVLLGTLKKSIESAELKRANGAQQEGEGDEDDIGEGDIDAGDIGEGEASDGVVAGPEASDDEDPDVGDVATPA